MRMRQNKLLIGLLASAIAFDNSAPAWKTGEDGQIELKDGNPVYLDSTGREMTVETTAISNLNAEAMKHRTEKEELAKQLKVFEGLDPKEAREAIQKVADFSEKDLIEAGEVERVRKEISESFTEKLTASDTRGAKLEQELNDLKISNVFRNSPFVRGDIAVPLDMFEATFKNNFKIEENKIVAVDKSGNRIMSNKLNGDYASPEEALQILVEQHPSKDSILKAPEARGTGNSGGGSGRANVIKRSEFDKLDQRGKSDALGRIKKGELKLTD